MQKEPEKYVRSHSAFTLVEVILVASMVALIGVALAGMVGNSFNDWKFSTDRSTLLQDGQAGVEQMLRVLRQAQRFIAVSQSTDTAGDITFTDVDGLTKQFRLNAATGELEYGIPGSLSALTGSITSLVFTCYDIDNNALAGAVPASSIQSVRIDTTVVDADDPTITFTLPGRIFCPLDFQYVVINEFMYNPPGAVDSANEWVEIYNIASTDIDLTGWTIWTDVVGSADPLSSHAQFGNGSTTIPVGGYAVITADSTNVYNELITAGDCESKNNFKNNWQKNNWDRTKFNAHAGTYKAESTNSGAASLYQDITVPAASTFNSCLFIFWEMTTASVAQTQMTVTIRDLSDTVLQTVYSGQFSASWTSHTIDLSAYANQSIRIHFATNKTGGGGALLLDDISVATSYVDINAIRLSTGDSRIGSDLSNNSGIVTITDGSSAVDTVPYDDAWGGSGDGTTLARISPQGSSSDSANWQSGPANGTPGLAN